MSTPCYPWPTAGEIETANRVLCAVADNATVDDVDDTLRAAMRILSAVSPAVDHAD